MKAGLNAWWWLVGLGAVGVVTAAVVLLGTHLKFPERPVTRKGTPPRIQAPGTPGDAVSLAVAESASLLGPAQLFLPTVLNGSAVDVPLSARREPGSDFPMVAPHWVFAERAFSVSVSDPNPAPISPLEALSYGQSAPAFPVLGAFDSPSSPLPARSVQVEASLAGQGRVTYSGAFTPTEPAVDLASDWRPLELLVAVDAAGQVGEAAVVRGSGSAEVDRYLADFLKKDVHLGMRLTPGFYSVIVGP